LVESQSEIAFVVQKGDPLLLTAVNHEGYFDCPFESTFNMKDVSTWKWLVNLDSA